MLDPPPERSVCGGQVNGPLVWVNATWHGRSTSFSGESGCNWPGGTALGVYWAAATHNSRALAAFEPRLRCDDDPVLLSKPTPWQSVAACTHGRWTARTERLIRLAEQTPPLPGLRPRTLFPHDIGTRRCEIQAGTLGTPAIDGLCGVNVTHVWKQPQVTLVETWGTGRRINRHTWHVTITHGQPHLAAQNGRVPPQFAE